MTTRRRMVYELDEVDKRRSKQERAAMGTPAREENTLAQDCAKVKDHRAPKSAAATAAVVVTRAAQLGLNDPAWAKLREAEYAAFVLELQKNREAIGRDSELAAGGGVLMLTEKLSPGEEARLRCYLDFKSEGPIRSIETGYDFALDAPLPVPQAIRRRCLHCVGGESVKEVRDCTAAPNICRLWPYRMGHGRDRTRDAKPPSRLKAIRQECLFCMGGSAQFVRECESSHCFLWPYRMGKKPDHMVTDAKRESGRRLAASVWR